VSLDYIRNYYGVPAKRGMRVEYCGHDNVRRKGTVTGASYAHVRVRLDGEKISKPYHPKDDYLIYLTGITAAREG
jgi:hypothetical protein